LTTLFIQGVEVIQSQLVFYICKLHIIFLFIHIIDIMAKDPVCNMMVDEKKAQHISEVNGGQKVYLCSAHCKSQFDQNPNKYGY
jgi:YHS domain-containing protein